MDLSGSWEYIEGIARSRLAHNKTSHHVSDYGDEIEVLGAAGEICARRFLGLPETLHDEFDDGVDFSFAGHSVDVKSTVLTPKIAYRFLQWPRWKEMKADIILLAAVDVKARYGTVIGWAYGREILAAPVNNSRPTPCHEIRVKDLHPAWEMVQIRRQFEQADPRSRHQSVDYTVNSHG